MAGAASLAVLAMAGCASAPSGEQQVQKLDQSEIARLKAAPTLFISPSGQPFRAAPGEPYPVSAWFAQADKNHDGRIDRAEFRADAEAFFRLLDSNHDGVIDGFELSDYEHAVVPEILGAYRGSGDHDRGPGRRQSDVLGLQGAVAFELFSKPEPVAAADLKVDGHITLAEFLAAADRDFDTLDKAGRGYLTLDALPKTPLQAALEGGKKGKR